jgi:hypothetical protein
LPLMTSDMGHSSDATCYFEIFNDCLAVMGAQLVEPFLGDGEFSVGSVQGSAAWAGVSWEIVR